MFFEVDLHDTIRLKPTYLSAGTKTTIEKQLRSNTEGQFKLGYGIILRVTQILNIDKGKISSRTGCASYEIDFKAMVLRPYSGLVVDAKISNMNTQGIFANAGPLDVFVPHKSLPDGYDFDYDSQSFINREKGKKFEIESIIRVRLVTAAPHKDQMHISATATIKDENLGDLSDNTA